MDRRFAIKMGQQLFEIAECAECFLWDPTEPVATRPLMFSSSMAPALLYCHDGNKNVSDLVAIDGVVAAHYEYSSFGKVVMAASGVQSDGLPPHLLNPYRFSSECHDDTLGLVYYNYRHYNPVDGRWLGRDAIEEEGGTNLYGFVCNCAIYRFDKNGEFGIVNLITGMTIPEIIALGMKIAYCYAKSIGSAGDCGNRDGYAHCVVACNFNNCMGGDVGKIGRVESALVTIAGMIGWEVVSGWEDDAMKDILSGLNGIKGSIAGVPCEDACKCEGSNMP